MSKYIVKNCPCVSTSSENEPLCYECLNNNPREPWRCMDRDCLIKQVIDDCKESIEYYENEGWKLDDMLEHSGKATMAFRLLQLFEIEEYE